MAITTVEILKMLPSFLDWTLPYGLISLGCLVVGFAVEWIVFHQSRSLGGLAPFGVFLGLIVLFEGFTQIDSTFSGLNWAVFLIFSLMLFIGGVEGAVSCWLFRRFNHNRPR